MELAEYIRRRADEVAPGLRAEAIAKVEAEVGVRLPADLRGLLAEVGGYEPRCAARWQMEGEKVTFAVGGPHADGELFPACLFLLHSGCGDHWILDIDPVTGECGPVVLASHDPPYFQLQFRTLEEFVVKTLDAEFDLEAHTELGEQNCLEFGLRVGEARESADAAVREFAAGLSEDYAIFDLRGRPLPCGFYWGLTDPDSGWKRWKHELLFALSDKPVPPRTGLGLWALLRKVFLGR